MKRRNVILLLGGASSGAMSAGTGAFSSVNAERSVEVNVVPDDEAYLGIEQNRSVLPTDTANVAAIDDDGSATDVVKIKNQFVDDLAVNVTVERNFGAVEIENPIKEVEGFPEEDRGTDDRLSPGEQAFISLTQNTTETGDLKITFYGEADGTTVEKTRTFDVTLIEVEFNGEHGNGADESNGGGAVHIHGEFENLDVKINGDKKTITADEGGKAVITPSDGQVTSVIIDGITYEPNSSSSTSDSGETNGGGGS